MAKYVLHVPVKELLRMRNLLGSKGANLAEMTNLGLPIPKGFTVTTKHAQIIMITENRFLP